MVLRNWILRRVPEDDEQMEAAFIRRRMEKQSVRSISLKTIFRQESTELQVNWLNMDRMLKV